jgi:hypothetical protein
MAMQADSFWVNLLKANSKPLVVLVLVLGGTFGWLCLLHYLHQKDSSDQIVSNNVWNQQLSAVNPRDLPAQSFSQTVDAQTEPGQSAAAAALGATFGTPSMFGSPRSPSEGQSPDGAMSPSAAYSNQPRPSLAPLMFSAFMPGGYQPQPSAAPQSLALSKSAPMSRGGGMPQGAGMPQVAGMSQGAGMPQVAGMSQGAGMPMYAPSSYGAPAMASQQQLFPARVHSAERYRMVVSR